MSSVVGLKPRTTSYLHGQKCQNKNDFCVRRSQMELFRVMGILGSVIKSYVYTSDIIHNSVAPTRFVLSKGRRDMISNSTSLHLSSSFLSRFFRLKRSTEGMEKL